MRRRFIPTALAIAFFTVLFWYANKYEVDEILPPGEEKPVVLASFDVNSVRAFSLKTPDYEVSLESVEVDGERSWNVVAPFASRAETTELTGILRGFSSLRSLMVVDSEPSSVVEFGIGTNSPVITITADTGTIRLVRGNQVPFGNDIYIQRDGDPAVYIVPGFIAANFQKRPEEFRSRQVFGDIRPEKVVSINLVLPDETVDLFRDGGGTWQISSPREVEGDQVEINALIEFVRDLRAARFIDSEEDESMGFDQPRVSINLGLSDGGRIEFVAGGQDGEEVFVKRADQGRLFAIQEFTVFRFEKDFNTLRDKRLPVMPLSEVNRINLGIGQKDLSLELADGRWQHGDKDCDKELVNRFLSAYAENHIREFLPIETRESYNLSELADKDRFTIKTEKSEVSVFFGTGDGAEIAVIIDGHGELFLVPIKVHETFKQLWDSLQDPYEDFNRQKEKEKADTE